MPDGRKQRVALVGTGHRGAGAWGRDPIAGWSDRVELVWLCDLNSMRLERARAAIGSDALSEAFG